MHIKKDKELPIEFLRECFNYNAETGDLTWKVRPQNHFPTKKGCNVFNSRCACKKAGFQNSRGYIAVNIGSYAYLSHRVSWALHYGVWPEKDIDHVSGDKTDNRISNLRMVTREINSRNQKLRKTNSSTCMGVTKDRGSFRVRINVDGKRLSVGTFATLDEAIAARKQAERRNEYHENHGR